MIPKREFPSICKYIFKFKFACHSCLFLEYNIIKIISRGSYTHRSHHSRMSCLLRFRHWERCSCARMCDIKHWFTTYHLTTVLINHLLLWRLNSTLLLRLPISINRAVCTRLYILYYKNVN